MNRPSMLTATALILIALQGVQPATPATVQSLSLPEIVHAMEVRDQEIAQALAGYTCERRYSLENHRFHKTAALRVRMTYTQSGGKHFDILSEEGSAVIGKKVLRPMLAAEEEASREDVRPKTRITEANYRFQLLGVEKMQGRSAYSLEVSPKTRNKFLIRGKVWVDCEDYGIVRVEAAPAQSPSILIRNTHVVQQSTRFDGGVWLPLYNHSDSDSLLFGRTDVSIDSSDYAVKVRGK